MPVPTWLSALGHFGSDILGGILGARLSEPDWKRQVAVKIGEHAGKVVLPDREDIMKELLKLGEDSDAIIALLTEARRNKFIQIGAKKYREGWIITTLLEVDPQDRRWVFEFLNSVCTRSREDFFTLLEIINKDDWVQFMWMAGVYTKEGALRSSAWVKANFPRHRRAARRWMRKQTCYIAAWHRRHALPVRPRRFRHILSAVLWLFILVVPVIIIGLLVQD